MQTTQNTHIIAPIPAKTEPTRVSLDDMAKDLQDLELVEKMLAEWQARKEEITKRIKDRIGENGVGTLNGRDVFAYQVTAGFASQRFAKEQPDLAAQFTSAKVVQQLNTDMLAQSLPEVYQAYQVRTLKRLGSRA